jgi:hypothetical protein
MSTPKVVSELLARSNKLGQQLVKTQQCCGLKDQAETLAH